MDHTTIRKEKGHYNAFPRDLYHLPDGRLTLGFQSAPFANHLGLQDFLVYESRDSGETWARSDDPALPPNWAAASIQERRTWVVPGFGSSGVGYPSSVELDDATILTVDYITTPDAITHVAATRWHHQRDRPWRPVGALS